MMNPLQYLSSVISSLTSETALLEACDWDEERAEYVKSELEKCMNQVLSVPDFYNSKSLLENISQKLLDNIDEKELKVCLHIIEGFLENPHIFKGDGYEN